MPHRFRRRSMPRSPARGFSLVELLVVVNIILAMAAVAVQSYDGFAREARETRAAYDLDLISRAVDRFETERGLPASGEFALDQLGGRYLDQVPLDPWGQPYRVDLFFRRVGSAGPDGIWQTPMDALGDAPRDETALGGDDLLWEYGYLGEIVVYSRAESRAYALRPDGSGVVSMPLGSAPNDPRGAAYAGRDGTWLVHSDGDSIRMYRIEIARAERLRFEGQALAGYHAGFGPTRRRLIFADVAGVRIGVADLDEGDPRKVLRVRYRSLATVVDGGDWITRPTLDRRRRWMVTKVGTDVLRIAMNRQDPPEILNVDPTGRPLGDAFDPPEIHASISPDGRRVAYVARDGARTALKVLEVPGGAAYVVLRSDPGRPPIQSMAWSPDGNRLAYTDGVGVFVTPAVEAVRSRSRGVYPSLIHAGGLGLTSVSWN